LTAGIDNPESDREEDASDSDESVDEAISRPPEDEEEWEMTRLKGFADEGICPAYVANKRIYWLYTSKH
jgi:hypothetical protein